MIYDTFTPIPLSYSTPSYLSPFPFFLSLSLSLYMYLYFSYVPPVFLVILIFHFLNSYSWILVRLDFLIILSYWG